MPKAIKIRHWCKAYAYHPETNNNNYLFTFRVSGKRNAHQLLARLKNVRAAWYIIDSPYTGTHTERLK